MVIRARQRSQVRALTCASAWYPAWASNAASIRARAAVCLASARSSASSASAWTLLGSDPASAAFSASRARSSTASAPVTLTGSRGSHMLITSALSCSGL